MSYLSESGISGDGTKTYRMELDNSHFKQAMKDLSASTEKFGSLFSSTMKNAIKSGKGFEDVLKSMAMRMSEMALSQAFKPLDNLITSGLQSLVAGFSPGGGAGLGSGSTSGMPINITPFAKGGVVGSPSYFSFADRLGVMGEKGPEAVMPLARGPDGRLGVAGGSSNTANITFNVSTNDAEGFRKSEGQITAMLARAVARGQRKL